jgi:hypothetical protein
LGDNPSPPYSSLFAFGLLTAILAIVFVFAVPITYGRGLRARVRSSPGSE